MMKRMPLILVVAVGVTGLFGAARAVAEGSMSGSSGGGASSSGGASVGGWTGAPERKEKAGTGVGAPTVVNKGITTTTVASKGSATTAMPATSKGGAAPATPATSKAGATADARGQTNVGGILPMVMSGADSKVEVKNLDNGVTLTITSSDPAMAVRLKKMAEAMRLMNEAMRP